MAIDILSEPSQPADAERITRDLESAIAGAIPDGRIEVRNISPGHFEIDVVAPVFDGMSRVKQQQLVYGAIAPLMRGDPAPVHAIDRLTTRTR